MKISFWKVELEGSVYLKKWKLNAEEKVFNFESEMQSRKAAWKWKLYCRVGGKCLVKKLKKWKWGSGRKCLGEKGEKVKVKCRRGRKCWGETNEQRLPAGVAHLKNLWWEWNKKCQEKVMVMMNKHENILLSTLVSAPQDSESNPSGLKLIVHFTGHRLIG